MQQRLAFAVTAVPIAAVGLGAAMRRAPALGRTLWFFGLALLLAALFIASPFDPRIPHTEHMAVALHGFVMPLVGTCLLTIAWERFTPTSAPPESRLAAGALAALFSVLLLLASGILTSAAGIAR